MSAAEQDADVLRLYPQPGLTRPLRGTYLEQGLRADTGGGTLIYANFISSLDGRVALPNDRGAFGVPETIANKRDWRLFQELAIQADALLVSGRYLRARARGEVQDLFVAFHESTYSDLRRWRAARALPAWPRIVVVSRAVDFEPPAGIDPGLLLVLTGAFGADSAGASRLRSAGAQVIEVGASDEVEARNLRAALLEAGCRRVYAVGGPRVLHLLASAGALDLLFLSLEPKLLGGERLATLVEGDLLDPTLMLRLRSLYYDLTNDSTGAGQLFACYEVAQ